MRQPGRRSPQALLGGCSLRPLLVALNDEDPQVRELAIQVVGRLGGLNPAVVMPALRRHLMQLLADLDHSPDSRQREGAPLRRPAPTPVPPLTKILGGAPDAETGPSVHLPCALLLLLCWGARSLIFRT